MNEIIPWYRSPVFVGVIVSVIMQVLALLHVADKVAEADLSKLVDLVLQLIALAAAGYAAWKRQRSPIQPLASTQKSADNKNAASPVAPPGT